MSDSLEEYDRKVSIGGIKFTKLWVDDDIDALAEEEQGWKSRQNVQKV